MAQQQNERELAEGKAESVCVNIPVGRHGFCVHTQLCVHQYRPCEYVYKPYVCTLIGRICVLLSVMCKLLLDMHYLDKPCAFTITGRVFVGRLLYYRRERVHLKPVFGYVRLNVGCKHVDKPCVCIYVKNVYRPCVQVYTSSVSTLIGLLCTYIYRPLCTYVYRPFEYVQLQAVGVRTLDKINRRPFG